MRDRHTQRACASDTSQALCISGTHTHTRRPVDTKSIWRPKNQRHRHTRACARKRFGCAVMQSVSIAVGCGLKRSAHLHKTKTSSVRRESNVQCRAVGRHSGIDAQTRRHDRVRARVSSYAVRHINHFPAVCAWLRVCRRRCRSRRLLLSIDGAGLAR